MKKGVPISAVKLEDVQQFWYDSDPHTAIEAHLPELISTDYIEKIYITKMTEESLPPALREQYADLFVVTNDTREDVFKLMKQPRVPKINPAGYSFYVQPESMCFIPVDLRNSEAASVTFKYMSAVSNYITDLVIVFTETLEQPRKEGEACAVFRITNNGIMRCGNIQQAREASRVMDKKEGDNGVPSSYYTIWLGNSLIKVSGNKNECECRFNWRFIAFSVCEFDGVVNKYIHFILKLCLCVLFIGVKCCYS